MEITHILTSSHNVRILWKHRPVDIPLHEDDEDRRAMGTQYTASHGDTVARVGVVAVVAAAVWNSK